MEYRKLVSGRHEKRKEYYATACPKFQKIMKDNHILFVDLKRSANFDSSSSQLPGYEVFSTSGYGNAVTRSRFYIWPQDNLSKSKNCPRGYIKHLLLKNLLANIPEQSVTKSILAIWSAQDDEWVFKPMGYLRAYSKAISRIDNHKEAFSALKRYIRLVPLTLKEGCEPPFSLNIGNVHIQHEQYTILEEDELIPALAKYTDYDDGWRVRFKAGINILYRIGDLWT